MRVDLKKRQDGRFVIYSANFETTNELVGYLTENCCSGAGLVPRPDMSRPLDVKP